MNKLNRRQAGRLLQLSSGAGLGVVHETDARVTDEQS